MFDQKNIGIWGFGIVGKAACDFLYPRAKSITILEKKKIAQSDHAQLRAKNIRIWQQKPFMDLTPFFQNHDYIIISPGIDSSPYAQYRHKIIAEVDLFQTYFKKPIIAITGSIGKTSVTTLLAAALHEHGFRVKAAGNIGTGMLSCCAQQEKIDYAVLEVSSFQLEYATLFAPPLAIITNFYPNHLDRHKTESAYFDAKMRILRHQDEDSLALIPFDFLHNSRYHFVARKKHAFFSQKPLTTAEINAHCDKTVFWIENNAILMHQNNMCRPVMSCKDLPAFSFQTNWLIVVAALTLLELPLLKLKNISCSASALEHRLEYLATIDGASFYNDSKSTVPQSTLAAVDVLQSNDIILFLGGMSKGIDRSSLIAALQNKVISIVCFGAEAAQLVSFCKQYKILAHAHATLQEAFYTCMQTKPRSCAILFSPAGASYDLFADYKERGACFKQLVHDYAQKNGDKK